MDLGSLAVGLVLGIVIGVVAILALAAWISRIGAVDGRIDE